ncbi:hypothetical protein C8R43DRAFT_948790 [Mycena crocata]|nr:hypothetical protein C8R43DRAFT_948790 [Mycena crocata]
MNYCYLFNCDWDRNKSAGSSSPEVEWSHIRVGRVTAVKGNWNDAFQFELRVVRELGHIILSESQFDVRLQHWIVASACDGSVSQQREPIDEAWSSLDRHMGVSRRYKSRHLAVELPGAIRPGESSSQICSCAPVPLLKPFSHAFQSIPGSVPDMVRSFVFYPFKHALGDSQTSPKIRLKMKRDFGDAGTLPFPQCILECCPRLLALSLPCQRRAADAAIHEPAISAPPTSIDNGNSVSANLYAKYRRARVVWEGRRGSVPQSADTESHLELLPSPLCRSNIYCRRWDPDSALWMEERCGYRNWQSQADDILEGLHPGILQLIDRGLSRPGPSGKAAGDTRVNLSCSCSQVRREVKEAVLTRRQVPLSNIRKSKNSNTLESFTMTSGFTSSWSSPCTPLLHRRRTSARKPTWISSLSRPWNQIQWPSHDRKRLPDFKLELCGVPARQFLEHALGSPRTTERRTGRENCANAFLLEHIHPAQLQFAREGLLGSGSLDGTGEYPVQRVTRGSFFGSCSGQPQTGFWRCTSPRPADDPGVTCLSNRSSCNLSVIKTPSLFRHAHDSLSASVLRPDLFAGHPGVTHRCTLLSISINSTKVPTFRRKINSDKPRKICCRNKKGVARRVTVELNAIVQKGNTWEEPPTDAIERSIGSIQEGASEFTTILEQKQEGTGHTGTNEREPNIRNEDSPSEDRISIQADKQRNAIRGRNEWMDARYRGAPRLSSVDVPLRPLLALEILVGATTFLGPG